MIVQIGKSQRMMVNPGNSRPKICQVAEVAAAVATGPSVVSADPLSKKTFFRAMNQGSVRDLQIFGTTWGFLNIRGMGFMITRIATKKKQLFILLVRVG